LLFAEILKSADVASPRAANARIVGDDPVIPTRYRIGAACLWRIAESGREHFSNAIL